MFEIRKARRGFASMSPEKQREIASKGGKAAHQKGTAHEWTSEEAREAGRKGGMASHRRKQQQQNESNDQSTMGSAPENEQMRDQAAAGDGGEDAMGNESDLAR